MYTEALAAKLLGVPQSTLHYWLEGGVIGAATVGVLGTLWFRGMSDTRPGLGSTILVAALCSAAGFGPGSLIGGQFRKHARARRPVN